MKSIRHIVFIFAFISLFSCKNASEDKSVSLGTVEYHPAFLWEESEMIPVKRTFLFDFSQDAKDDKNCFAELQITDNGGTPVSTDIMQVFDGDKPLVENKIRITSDVDSIVLTFTLSPEAANGKYQGYLRLSDHNLDRIDSQAIIQGDKIDVLQWTLFYDKSMNPLAKILMWLGIIGCSLLFLWFAVLRPSFFPYFGKFTKSIIIRQNDTIIGQYNFAFKGAQKVFFSDKKVKQSILKRIFLGKTKTFVHPCFRTRLTFVPKGKNAAVWGVDYSVTPNPMPRNGVSTITNTKEKIVITLR